MPAPLSAEQRRRTLARIERLTVLMDSSLRVPGTSFRVGLDPLIGLIPGIGDAAGMIISAYPLFEARRLGVPAHTLARMSLNLLADAAIGAIPLVGDLFDFTFKANRRNLRLLRQALDSPVPTLNLSLP